MSKAFRVDWYPHAAYIDFSALKADEIGVLMQIINLIYTNNGPVYNDPKFIGKACGITRAKCARIVDTLIQSGHLYKTEEGKLFKKRCLEELKSIEKRRKGSSEDGEKGAKIRWENKENQEVGDGGANKDEMTSININTSQNKNINTYEEEGRKRFDIEDTLTDELREEMLQITGGQDRQRLIREFNDWINSPEQQIPKNPNAAFRAWCCKYKCK